MTKAKTGISIVAVVAALSLGGCDSLPDSLNPNKGVDSAGPNANVPGPQKTYPKLSSVPDRPPPRDEEAQKKSEQQLEADRQAGRAAAAAPENAALPPAAPTTRNARPTTKRAYPARCSTASTCISRCRL